MNPELEIGRLPVVDRGGKAGYFIVTSRRVCHESEGGIFGTSTTFIPNAAITGIRIGWRRLWWLMGVAMVLLAVSVLTMIEGLDSVLQYGLLAGSLILLLLFWFYKMSDIQIMSATVTLVGRPEKHDDGRTFCDLLLAVLGEREPSRSPAPATMDKKQATESEWKL